MIRTFAAVAVMALLLPGLTPAADTTLDLTVAAGDNDRVNEPICVPVVLKAAVADSQNVQLKDAAGKDIAVGQLTPPGILTKPQPVGAGETLRELHFILPDLKKGQTLALKAYLSTNGKVAGESFSWKDTPGEFAELSFGTRPVLRYMYRALDDSSKEKREQTFKVFHHLYDPTGKRLVTNNGPGSLYPHHRGLFFGFNKITYGNGKKVDIWHCTNDTYQGHEKFLESDAGPVLGRHRVEIAWHGVGKEVFAKEQRELTVYNVPGGQLVQFASKVATTDGPIQLDGDPQHSGFHFRAEDEVAKKSKQETIFIRPDGPGQPGTETNWDPETRKGPVNLPWNAMSFVLGGKRYTAAYLDNPANPKEARESERTYGRIGSYFEYQVTEAHPLLVRYRVWLQEGQMTVPQIAAKSAAFVNPADVKVK